MIVAHATKTTDLPPGAKIGATEWNARHEFRAPLSPFPGQYVSQSINSNINGTLQLAANRIHLVPINVTRPTQIDRIAAYVTTGVAGALLRIALYDQIAENGINGEAGWPGELLDSSPDMSAATSNAVAEFTVSRTLTPDRQYWAGVWANSTPTLRALSIGGSRPFLTWTNAAQTHIASIWRTLTFAGNPWPNPFGAVLLSELNAAQNQFPPAVLYRVTP